VDPVEGSPAESVRIPRENRARPPLWAVGELAIGYLLVLAVIWSTRPLQRWLYWLAIAWFLFAIVASFPGWKAMGCSATGFWRSSWVVGVALTLAGAGVAAASILHTLHHPSGLVNWILAFGGYSVWSLAQQFLLQGYFLSRLVRVVPSATVAAIIAAIIFALAHLPNPILTVLTLVWGLAACLVFVRSRNLWPLAIAHAIFGICVAITIPGSTSHNMRVGRGYLTYRAPRHPAHLSQIDHKVSTVAWVIDEAATRR
jgi:membrane protease YdiL (CAAX protease family)